MTLNASPTVYVMAVSSAPSEEEGKRIVRALVERRIIACGSVVPGATSIYRWKGVLEETAEVVILMKTTAARRQELERVLTELHPYEVPELVVLPIAGGHGPYLDWLSAET